MLFNSFEFLILVTITFALYYLKASKSYQIMLLIVSSAIFYAFNNPLLLTLLATSVTINTASSYLVHHGNPRYRRLYATCGVVLNLSILAFFKYSPLVASTFFPAATPATGDIGAFLLSIPLPIGISFFTFEGISLVVDVFRNQKRPVEALIPERNFITHFRDTSFFVIFFPHLVAGPILKAHDFLPQLGEKYFSDIDWQYVFKCLVTGYFLKMVVADNLKDLTYWITYPYFEAYSTIDLLLLLFGYSMQIFADFAGYSLIALGLAAMFGYRLMDNFNFPYISRSFSEFWRRWHISLSSWLKEYLYISLGGNRKGELRTYLNLIIVMFLGGLWHGAAWSYAVWGLFHGGALAIERLLQQKIRLKPGFMVSFCQTLLVFTFVTFAWLLFKLPEFSQVIAFVKALYNNTGYEFRFGAQQSYILTYSLPVILYHLYYLVAPKVHIQHKLKYQPLVYALMLFLIITNSGIQGDFIYFQF